MGSKPGRGQNPFINGEEGGCHVDPVLVPGWYGVLNFEVAALRTVHNMNVKQGVDLWEASL